MAMAKGRILIFSLIAAMAMLFTVSCSGPQYTKEIASLDSLQKQLDSAEVMLNAIDSTAISTAVSEVPMDLHDITMRFRTISHDSIMDRETATFISDYRSVLKPFKAYLREHKKLQADIDYSQGQIANLIHDLQKNIVDEKDAPQYIKHETDDAARTIQVTKMLANTVKEVMVRYNATKPKVKQYMESLDVKSSQPDNKTK